MRYKISMPASLSPTTCRVDGVACFRDFKLPPCDVGTGPLA